MMLAMGLLKMSDRAWEKSFRKVVEPQVKSGSPIIKVDLRDKSKTAAGQRVPQAAQIMEGYGYRLVDSYIGGRAMGGGLMTASGGSATFQRNEPTSQAQ